MMLSVYGVVGRVGGMLPCSEHVVAHWDADGLRCMFVGLVVGSAVVWSVNTAGHRVPIALLMG